MNFEMKSNFLDIKSNQVIGSEMLKSFNLQQPSGHYNTFWKRLRNYSARERRLWNLWIVCITLYNSIVIPLKLSFRDTWNISSTSTIILFVFDYIGDFFLILDIALRFMTPYYDDGFLIRDKKYIAIHYLRTWFPIDFIASLPLDFLDMVTWKHYLFRIVRLLRFFHFGEIFTSWRQYTIRFGAWIRITQLIVVLLLVVHWISCIYIAMAYAEDWPKNSFSPPQSLRNESFFEQYSFAFNFGVRFVTRVGGRVADPDTTLEQIVCTAEAVVILFLIASIIGSVTSIMNQIDPDKAQLDNKIERVNNFISKKNLGKELTNQVRAFVQKEFSKKDKVSDEGVILNMFPYHIRKEVILHMYKELIENVPFFSSKIPGLTESMIPFLREMTYEEGDKIINCGELVNEIYFIVNGKVAMLDDNNEVIEVLDKGDYFGETSLLQQTTSQATMKAITPVELFSLSRKNFEEVLSKFPEQKKLVISHAKVRIFETKLKSLLFSKTKANDREVCQFVDFFIPQFLSKGEMFFKPNLTSVYLVCEGTVEVKIRDINDSINELEVFGNAKRLPKGMDEYSVTTKTGAILFELEQKKLDYFFQTNDFSADNIWSIFLDEFTFKRIESKNVFRRSLSTVSKFSSAILSNATQRENLRKYLDNFKFLFTNAKNLEEIRLDDLFLINKKLQMVQSTFTNVIQEKTKK